MNGGVYEGAFDGSLAETVKCLLPEYSYTRYLALNSGVGRFVMYADCPQTPRLRPPLKINRISARQCCELDPLERLLKWATVLCQLDQ